MAEATLAIRPHDQKHYYRRIPSKTELEGAHVYVVALIPAPNFPGENHEQSVPLSVVCAQRYVTQVSPGYKWGWVHLTYETKEEIGNDLEAYMDDGYEVGTWIWLTLRYVETTDLAQAGQG